MTTIRFLVTGNENLYFDEECFGWWITSILDEYRLPFGTTNIIFLLLDALGDDTGINACVKEYCKPRKDYCSCDSYMPWDTVDFLLCIVEEPSDKYIFDRVKKIYGATSFLCLNDNMGIYKRWRNME